MLNRRLFLTRCTAAAASAVVPSAVLAAIADQPRPSRQLFATLIGQSFRGIDEDNVALNFVLLDVVRETRAPGLDQFTLVFEETYRIGNERSGGLFRLHHPDTGQMLMRLEPSAGGPRKYVSHFSLIA